jgi:hypothetical protein
VGTPDAVAVGKLVGLFDGTVVGPLVAPDSVGSILTVGKSVGVFEGRNVGLNVVCDGAGLGRSVGVSDGAGVGLKVGYSVTGAAVVASDGAVSA